MKPTLTNSLDELERAADKAYTEKAIVWDSWQAILKIVEDSEGLEELRKATCTPDEIETEREYQEMEYFQAYIEDHATK